MHLEDASPTLEEVLANTELLVACYYIIESAVSYMASDRLKQLDRRQRDQVRSDPDSGFQHTFYDWTSSQGDSLSSNWWRLTFYLLFSVLGLKSVEKRLYI